MRRILMMLLRNIIHLPKLWFKMRKYSKNVEKYSEEERNAFFKEIVYYANRGGNVTIEATGQENFPEENGFILFPNHQGMYDVLALVYACDKPLAVVAKKEAGKIPILKTLFKIMQALFIDREDVRQSMKVITQVTKEVQEGRNYIIFPEGTRSKNGNQMGEFKGGSFKAATKAKCPIVPVTLIDCFKPFDSKSLKQVTVQIHVLPPMLYDEYKDMKTVEIAEEVQRRIAETIEKNKKDVDN